MYILIVVDMSQEELRSYEKKLIHIDSELEMKYDVFVCDFSVPLEIFERTNGYYLHQILAGEEAQLSKSSPCAASGDYCLAMKTAYGV